MDYGTTQAPSLESNIVSLAIALLLSLILRWHFYRYSNVSAGRRETGNSLPFIVLIVTFMIMLVHTSLSLGLGLVGSLSIVRFRTPIKETEELAYLFMAIAIGIGAGAGQHILVITGSLIILVILAILAQRKKEDKAKSITVSLKWPTQNTSVSLDSLSNRLASLGGDIILQRIEIITRFTHALFSIESLQSSAVFALITKMASEYPELEAVVLDNSDLPEV